MHSAGGPDLVSSEAFLVTPNILLMSNIHLLTIMNNYANPQVLPFLHTQGMLTLFFVFIIEVLLWYFVNYFHLMAQWGKLSTLFSLCDASFHHDGQLLKSLCGVPS